MKNACIATLISHFFFHIKQYIFILIEEKFSGLMNFITCDFGMKDFRANSEFLISLIPRSTKCFNLANLICIFVQYEIEYLPSIRCRKIANRIMNDETSNIIAFFHVFDTRKRAPLRLVLLVPKFYAHHRCVRFFMEKCCESDEQ